MALPGAQVTRNPYSLITHFDRQQQQQHQQQQQQQHLDRVHCDLVVTWTYNDNNNNNNNNSNNNNNNNGYHQYTAEWTNGWLILTSDSWLLNNSSQVFLVRIFVRHCSVGEEDCDNSTQHSEAVNAVMENCRRDEAAVVLDAKTCTRHWRISIVEVLRVGNYYRLRSIFLRQWRTLYNHCYGVDQILLDGSLAVGGCWYIFLSLSRAIILLQLKRSC